MKNKNLKRLLALSTILAVTMSSFIGSASAAILFQDDTFHEILSDAIMIGSNDAGAVDTAIQFGSDVTSSENGTINWNITTNTFEFDHSVDITGGLTANGDVDFSGSTGMRLRESSSPSTLAACTTLNEVIINTTSNRLEICTATGVAGAATWVAPAPVIPTGAANPGTCAPGDIFFNTTSATLQVCTTTNTWNTAGPQDLEAVYGYDADGVLTTSGGNFGVATGGGNISNTLGAGTFDITSTGLIDFNSATFTLDTTGGMSIDAGAASNITTSAGDLTLEATTGSTNVTGGEAVADAVQITASNAAGGISMDSGTGGFDVTTTGAFSITGAADSTFTTTGAFDITITAGDDLFFDDAQLTSAVQLTDTATAINATYSTNGIIDALNSLTSTATGAGASNVGVEDAGGYFTGTDVEAALQELGAVSGSNAANNEVLTFYPQYPDAVLFADGADNKGTMAADYDDTNDEHYYVWTSNNASTQDMDIRFRFPLPADFVDVNDLTYRYRTGTTTEADNDVEVYLYNATDETAGNPTLCGSDTTNGTANVWATGTITKATLETGCTGGTVLSAGDIVEIAVKLLDNSGAADFANIGYLALGYNN